MAKRRRKQIKCLNCQAPLKEPFNFCPQCGQENNDNYVKFSALFKDFWTNYLSFDSRLGRTIKPLFFRPGEITNEFVLGKRVKYANPVRLYLLVSFVHFFIFLQYMGDREDIPAVVRFNSGNDSASIASLDKLTNDSTVMSDSADATLLNGMNQLIAMNRTNRFTVDEVYDSLNLEGMSKANRTFIYQFIKINRLTDAQLNQYILSQIPVGMFFFLPLVAVLLKLFHRKRMYILHLVHTLHLHSFALTILAIAWLVQWIFGIRNDPFVFIFGAAAVIYSFLSFKRVYEHGWIKTIVKFVSTGLLYTIGLSFTVVLIVLISFLLYR